MLVALVGTLSCGPSFEERQEQDKKQEDAARADAAVSLRSFSARYGAEPADLFPRVAFSRKLTATLQEEIQGATIAFRATLIDIVRLEDGEYQVLLGSPFYSGTIVALDASPSLASPLLARSPGHFDSYLVVADIERVAPMAVKLESCEGVDCVGMRLEASLLASAHHISGRAIAIESPQ